MSSLLKSYETEYKATFDQAINSLKIAKNQPLPERNVTLKSIEGQKDELNDLIDQMEIEINNSINSSSERANFKSKLRNYRKDIQLNLKVPLQDLIDSTDRDKLFGNVMNQNNESDSNYMNSEEWQSMTDEQRQQLIKNHSILQKSGDRLKDASRIANETEGIGSQIMNDLRSQRETLENARQTLFQADSYVDRSIKTLKVMSRRLVANKFISYAIIGVLILLILLVLFSKFK